MTLSTASRPVRMRNLNCGPFRSACRITDGVWYSAQIRSSSLTNRTLRRSLPQILVIQIVLPNKMVCLQGYGNVRPFLRTCPLRTKFFKKNCPMPQVLRVGWVGWVVWIGRVGWVGRTRLG